MLLLQVAALGGLVLGRRRLLVAPAVAILAGALLAGAAGSVLAPLALAGLALGTYLHDLVREDFTG
jgi:hypothetical protein